MKPTLEEQKQIILALAKATTRPLLVGDAAMRLGWWATLDETEHLIQGMVQEGTLRQMTVEEGRQYGVRYGFFTV